MYNVFFMLNVWFFYCNNNLFSFLAFFRFYCVSFFTVVYFAKIVAFDMLYVFSLYRFNTFGTFYNFYQLSFTFLMMLIR